MTLKLEAYQAKMVYKFINIISKLSKTKLHIKFNKNCLKLKFIPRFLSLIHICVRELKEDCENDPDFCSFFKV